MSVTIQIGDQERAFSNVSESWITDQIGRRSRDGVPICVVVNIQEAGINVRLTTPACSGGSVGGRLPNPRETQIIDLWNERRLNSGGFAAGNVIAFLKQLRHFI